MNKRKHIINIFLEKEFLEQREKQVMFDLWDMATKGKTIVLVLDGL